MSFPQFTINLTIIWLFQDEIHVDGGTGTQVFVYPAAIDWRKTTEKLKVEAARRYAQHLLQGFPKAKASDPAPPFQRGKTP